MENKVRFGICSDIHLGTMPEEEKRLSAFIHRMTEENVDFIVDLGDMTPGANPGAAKLWERFPGVGYHVLGNHDMDRYSKEEAVKLYGMPAPYYSFDQGNFHFVVMDTNSLRLDGKDVDYDHGNYYRYPDRLDWISQRQLEWLRQDLEATDKRTILFSHQYLGDPVYGVHNAEALTEILLGVKDGSGRNKVIACMNGHHHTDGVKIRNGIYYIYINGMSFFYMGGGISIDRFSREVSEKIPFLRETAPFADLLFTIFTLTEDSLSCEACNSSFVGPSPLESGHCGHCGGHYSTPCIEAKNLPYLF